MPDKSRIADRLVDVAPDQLAIVCRILSAHVPDAEVLAFGSRVRGTSHKHSDLDLAVRGRQAMSLSTLGELLLAFQESDLLFRVDIVDWHTISPQFRNLIQADSVPLQRPVTRHSRVDGNGNTEQFGDGDGDGNGDGDEAPTQK